MKSARETLSAAELRQALQFVRQYCVPDVGERFISHALEGLFHLFPCLVASYGELDPIRLRGLGVWLVLAFASVALGIR